MEWWDQYAQGGDYNLVLDKNDKVWSKLRLWFPEHCLREPTKKCVSLDRELRTLDEFGINSFSLEYEPSKEVDAVGNHYRFRAVLNPDSTISPSGERKYEHTRSRDGRYAKDVYLAVKP